MAYTKTAFSFSGGGVTWGFIGGSLGAFGALTLTLAMFSFPTGTKPRPDIVMPIVFGGAVTVTAITGYLQTRGLAGAHAPSPWLWIGMLGMAVCIVVVASNTPHAPPKKPGQPATPVPTPEGSTDSKPPA